MHLAELAVSFADDGLPQTGETLKQAAEVIDKLTYENTCLAALVQSLEKEKKMIDREQIQEFCLGLLSDENGDLNDVNFKFIKDDKNEIIVKFWTEDTDQ